MAPSSNISRARRGGSLLGWIRTPKFLRVLKAKLTRFHGPMAQREEHVVLDENYLNKFDEIVVIGDIHGCYDEFKELLAKVHNDSPSGNPEKCLKILVGDLVNKGPKNRKVLQACRDIYPNSIIAVRGNHDEIVLAQHKKFKETREPLLPKNKWIESLPSRYVSYLGLLPYSISIPTLNCIIVHAGIDPSKEDPVRETPNDLLITIRNIVVERDSKTNETSYRCTKSGKEGAAWATFWPGPQHVYFGHDARRRLQNDHEFATGLDTGCVYGDRLSYIYIKGSKKGEISYVKAREVYEATSDTEKPTTSGGGDEAT